jgi:hypothetical protein
VEACDSAGIAFIGPKAEIMRAVGDNLPAVFFDKGKSHLLCTAENTVAFLGAPSPPSAVGSLCEAVHSLSPDQSRRQAAGYRGGTFVSILQASKNQRPDQTQLGVMVVH